MVMRSQRGAVVVVMRSQRGGDVVVMRIQSSCCRGDYTLNIMEGNV